LVVNVQWLTDVTRDNLDTIGGKGANLGEMVKQGMPVPKGFCLTSDAYRMHLKFWDLAGTLQPLLAAQRWTEVEQLVTAIFISSPFLESVEADLRAAYRQLGISCVAVRSSATAEDLGDASFAGQQETFLNVTGDRALLDAVRRCWASLWSVRALTYRQRIGIDHLQVGIAVVIQEMLAPDSAGVLFTVDPADVRHRRMLLQVTRGDGEKLVSGRVAGDTYRISRGTPPNILERVLEHPLHPVLDDEQILQLSSYARLLEDHFGTPQDVEFAVTSNQIALLQSRPITTLAQIEPEPLPLPEKRSWLQRSISAASDDRYPVAPKPIDHLFFEVVVNAISHFLRDAGFRISEKSELRSKDQIWRTCFPVPAMWPTWRLILFPVKVVRTLFIDWDRRWDPYRCRLTDSNKRLALAAGSEQHLFPQIEAVISLWQEAMKVRFALLFGLMAEPLTKVIIGLVVSPRRKGTLIYDLMAGIDTPTTEINRMLARLATQARQEPSLREAVVQGRIESLAEHPAGRSFLEEVDRFLGDFGHREGLTWYISTPNWRHDQSRFWRLLGTLVERAQPVTTDSNQRFLEAQKLLESRLSWLPPLRRCLVGVINRLRAIHAFRENSQFDVLRPLDALQTLIFECGHRLRGAGVIATTDDVCYLTWPEIVKWMKSPPSAGEARDHLARRRATYRLVNDQWQKARYRQKVEADAVLRGIPVSPGIVSGRARVILDEGEFSSLQQGEVLVCQHTSPDWTPLFSLTAGVVTEIGGTLSHAAIVAREYQIPAVMGVAGATRRIRNGQNLLVDGNAGKVYLN
jgi:phosphohistidine swiveling domain-containing protein